MLILGLMNRATGERTRRLRPAVPVRRRDDPGLLWRFIMEFIPHLHAHGAFLSRDGIVVPMVLAALARGSGYRWAATTGPAFTGVPAADGWILPLFPAQPKLGPVYQHVTYSCRPISAAADCPRFGARSAVPAHAAWGRWQQSLVSGAVFLAVFVAVQWPFATFLMTPAARNWFFGANISATPPAEIDVCPPSFSPRRAAR